MSVIKTQTKPPTNLCNLPISFYYSYVDLCKQQAQQAYQEIQQEHNGVAESFKLIKNTIDDANTLIKQSVVENKQKLDEYLEKEAKIGHVKLQTLLTDSLWQTPIGCLLHHHLQATVDLVAMINNRLSLSLQSVQWSFLCVAHPIPGYLISIPLITFLLGKHVQTLADRLNEISELEHLEDKQLLEHSILFPILDSKQSEWAKQQYGETSEEKSSFTPRSRKVLGKRKQQSTDSHEFLFLPYNVFQWIKNVPSKRYIDLQLVATNIPQTVPFPCLPAETLYIRQIKHILNYYRSFQAANYVPQTVWGLPFPQELAKKLSVQVFESKDVGSHWIGQEMAYLESPSLLLPYGDILSIGLVVHKDIMLRFWLELRDEQLLHRIQKQWDAVKDEYSLGDALPRHFIESLSQTNKKKIKKVLC